MIGDLNMEVGGWGLGRVNFGPTTWQFLSSFLVSFWDSDTSRAISPTWVGQNSSNLPKSIMKPTKTIIRYLIKIN